MKLDFSTAVEYRGDILILNKADGRIARYTLCDWMSLPACPEPALKALVLGWSSVDQDGKRLDVVDEQKPEEVRE
jgi:hypothetical protein